MSIDLLRNFAPIFTTKVVAIERMELFPESGNEHSGSGLAPLGGGLPAAGRFKESALGLGVATYNAFDVVQVGVVGVVEVQMGRQASGAKMVQVVLMLNVMLAYHDLVLVMMPGVVVVVDDDGMLILLLDNAAGIGVDIDDASSLLLLGRAIVVVVHGHGARALLVVLDLLHRPPR